jgi:hypothetical protein
LFSGESLISIILQIKINLSAAPNKNNHFQHVTAHIFLPISHPIHSPHATLLIYRFFRTTTMSTQLSPLVSEFETEEQEASYTAWLQAKVKASLEDPRPSIPHDHVMAEMRELIDSKFKARHAG